MAISFVRRNMQRCVFSLETCPNVTTEAAFTPDGQYVVSGWILYPRLLFITLFHYSVKIIGTQRNCYSLFSSSQDLAMEPCMRGTSAREMRYLLFPFYYHI